MRRPDPPRGLGRSAIIVPQAHVSSVVRDLQGSQRGRPDRAPEVRPGDRGAARGAVVRGAGSPGAAAARGRPHLGGPGQRGRADPGRAGRRLRQRGRRSQGDRDPQEDPAPGPAAERHQPPPLEADPGEGQGSAQLGTAQGGPRGPGRLLGSGVRDERRHRAGHERRRADPCRAPGELGAGHRPRGPRAAPRRRAPARAAVVATRAAAPTAEGRDARGPRGRAPRARARDR